MNFAKFLKTPFSQNTSERLLLCLKFFQTCNCIFVMSEKYSNKFLTFDTYGKTFVMLNVSLF